LKDEEDIVIPILIDNFSPTEYENEVMTKIKADAPDYTAAHLFRMFPEMSEKIKVAVELL
jgi:hypothetical protein